MVLIDFTDVNKVDHRVEFRNLPKEITIREAQQMAEKVDFINSTIKKKYKGPKEDRALEEYQDSVDTLKSYAEIIVLLSNIDYDLVMQMPPDAVYDLVDKVKVDEYEQKNIGSFEFLSCTKEEYDDILVKHSQLKWYNILKKKGLRKEANSKIVTYHIRPEWGNNNFGVHVEGEVIKKQVAEELNIRKAQINSLPNIIALIANLNGKEKYSEIDHDYRQMIFLDLDLQTGMNISTFFLKSHEIFTNCIKIYSKEELQRNLSQVRSKST